MPDLATISAFLGSIKTATEIAKAIKGAEVSLEKAEIKLKMAELISALADVKIQAAEIQEVILEKDKEIAELKNLIQTKSQLIRENNLYYELGDTEFRKPFCPHCWEVNQSIIHLISTITPYLPQFDSLTCLKCKNSYKRLKIP